MPEHSGTHASIVHTSTPLTLLDGIRPIRHKHRRTVNVALSAFPEISHLGFDVFTRVGQLGKHEHPGEFEICLIIRGHVTWWARDRMYDLRGGDVYITWPDEPHGGLHALMHPCTIFWTTVRIPKPQQQQPKGQRFLNLPSVEARTLCAALHALPDRHLRGAETLEPYYEALFDALETRTVLGVIRARAALQGMLATLVTLPLASEPQGFVPPGISRAREFLDSCPTPWPSVIELAGLSGMSASRIFTPAFCAKSAPRRWNTPTAPACLAPRSCWRCCKPAVSRAERLGYYSSQHLAACFRRYLGQTPSEAAHGKRRSGSSDRT